MITFENGLDIRTRQVDRPQVARLYVAGPAAPWGYRYIVIGTDYGHIHTTGGDVRTWQTASGARKALKRYVAMQTRLREALK